MNDVKIGIGLIRLRFNFGKGIDCRRYTKTLPEPLPEAIATLSHVGWLLFSHSSCWFAEGHLAGKPARGQEITASLRHTCIRQIVLLW